MALRIDYLARETGQNLVRNIGLTIATVLTVGVSLSLLAGVILLTKGVENAFERWNNDVSFIVYLNPDAPQEQIDSLGKELRDSPQVATVTYLDKAASYDAFKKLFPDQPTITDTVKAEDLPTSFRVKPTNPNAKVVEQLAQSFRSKPGVYQVDFIADAIRAVQEQFSKLLRFASIGAGVLLVASLLLIFNTIQTAVFSRRREIEVMRLVGATNWYIRTPFVLEGLITGVVGAAIASLGAWILQIGWQGSFQQRLTPTLFDSIRWTNGQFNWTILWLFVIGSVVGAVGSAASVSWYLRA
jgi:cell division transport system permease protein